MSATATPAARPDNLLGVCARLGEDFGFDPLWLRIAFGVALIVNLEATLLVYVALGGAVLLSRLLAPAPRAVEAPAAVVPDAPEPEYVEELRRAA